MAVRTAPLLVTVSGKQIDLLSPGAGDIDIGDIAHGLSNICRWGGQTSRFYSVAEHCVLVSHVCSDPKWGLLHDAAEAYLGDVVRPLKPLLGERYRALEIAWMVRIQQQLGLSYMPHDLADADDAVAMVEAEALMPPGSISGQMDRQGIKMPTILSEHRYRAVWVRGLVPADARRAFLARWEEIR